MFIYTKLIRVRFVKGECSKIMAADKSTQNAQGKGQPLRRQPKQQRSQEQIEQILQAAAAVFWEVGFDAATTHAIAAKANTAAGNLYRFFPNKLAPFHALEKQH